ncbi:uncharacterized protein LOC110619666 [Manihot esculenta]|uniref:uncharacterized protein LOC110619666 n=1 Tax=Manihot esculenta TaxID=3983 RepID=UPI000B5D1507|nr:uncharacterized protein LOC110619666 [Manihot esculenta]
MDIILSKVDIGLFVIMVPILSRHLQCQNPCGKDFGMLKVSLKVKLFMWRFSKSILPAKDKLITCRVDVHSDCPVCGSHDESLLHLFFEYSLSLQLWDSMGKDWGPVLSSLEWLVEVQVLLWHGWCTIMMGFSGWEYEILSGFMFNELWRFMEPWLWDAARTRKSPSWLYETETAMTMVIPFCRLGRWSYEQPLVDLCI